MTNDEVNALKKEVGELKQLIITVLERIEPPPTKLTFGEWLATWRYVYKAELSAGYLCAIDAAIKYIPSWIKTISLDLLTAEMILEVLSTVKNGRTKESVYGVFSGALNTAYEQSKSRIKIMDKVKAFKHKRNKGKALSLDEQRNFFIKIQGTPLENIFKLIALTGCRRSEAAFLKWKDVHFRRNYIQICGTKTENSDRVIPLFWQTKELLKSLHSFDSQGRIFNFKCDYLTKQFKKFCPTHKLHDLRHTFATRCLESGISIKVVQQWLGHADIKTTSETYLHICQSLELAEADKFDLEPTIFDPYHVAEAYKQLRF